MPDSNTPHSPQLRSPAGTDTPSARARLRRSAVCLSCWHLLALVAVSGLLSRPLGTASTLQWLVQASMVLAYVHHRLRVHLWKNHAPGQGRLRSCLGWANTITLARGFGAAVVAGFCFLGASRTPEASAWVGWMAGLVYWTMGGADALDGWLARRSRTESLLGRHLDTEMDALGLLIASGLAVWMDRLPGWYLAGGICYYLFTWAKRRRALRGDPVFPLVNRPFSRYTAGVQMGFAGAALLPVFAGCALKLAALFVLLPLVLGFAWDWMQITGRLTPRTAAVTRMALEAMAAKVPVAVRAVVLFWAIPAAEALHRALPGKAWAAWTFLGAMMVLGFAGRSAAVAASCLLAHLTLVTGCRPVLSIVFVCGIVIIISGTGGVSLWQPEDRIVRCTPGKTVSAGGET